MVKPNYAFEKCQKQIAKKKKKDEKRKQKLAVNVTQPVSDNDDKATEA